MVLAKVTYVTPDLDSKAPDDPDASALAAWVERGDRQALEAVFRRHADCALRMAARRLGNLTDAEDAVQEAFIGVMRGARRARVRSVRGWILVAVMNACSAQRRRDRQRRAREQYSVSPPPAESDADLRDAIIRALEQLPQHQRQPVELRYLAGLEYREIAHALGRRERTVRGQVDRGLENLHALSVRYGFAAGSTALIAALATLPTVELSANACARCIAIAKSGPQAASLLTYQIGMLGIIAATVTCIASVWWKASEHRADDSVVAASDGGLGQRKAESRTVVVDNAREDYGHDLIYRVNRSGEIFVMTGTNKREQRASIGLIERDRFRYYDSDVPWFGTYDSKGPMVALDGGNMIVAGLQKRDDADRRILVQTGSARSGFSDIPESVAAPTSPYYRNSDPQIFKDTAGILNAAWFTGNPLKKELHCRRKIASIWQPEQIFDLPRAFEAIYLDEVKVAGDRWYVRCAGSCFIAHAGQADVDEESRFGSIVYGQWIVEIGSAGVITSFIGRDKICEGLDKSRCGALNYELVALGDSAWLITSINDFTATIPGSITLLTAIRVHAGQVEPGEVLWDSATRTLSLAAVRSGLDADGKLCWVGLADALGDARHGDPRGCLVVMSNRGPDDQSWSPVRRLVECVPLDAGAVPCGEIQLINAGHVPPGGIQLSDRGVVLLGRHTNVSESERLRVTTMPWSPLIDMPSEFVAATIERRRSAAATEIAIKLPDTSELTLFVQPTDYNLTVSTICSRKDPAFIAAALDSRWMTELPAPEKSAERFSFPTARQYRTGPNGWMIGPNGELVAAFRWSERRGPVDPDAMRRWELAAKNARADGQGYPPQGELLGLALDFSFPAHFRLEIPDLEVTKAARTWGPIPNQ
jgi:RNA polymerase sigma-70 factor, ECF subfamily